MAGDERTCRAIKGQLRFIFLLKSKSELSRLLWISERRRLFSPPPNKRSPRRISEACCILHSLELSHGPTEKTRYENARVMTDLRRAGNLRAADGII